LKAKFELLTTGTRDLRFDSLRGLFLVCMTVNHLPTEIRLVTDQSLGIFSAAEGFVFMSGLIAGWVYTRKLRKLGNQGLLTSSLQRADSIYRWQIGSFVAALVCVQVIAMAIGYCSPAVPKLFFEHPMEALGLGLTLLYQPGLLDLLPMYCGFVLLLPAALRALEAGRTWAVIVPSALVWLAMQFAPDVSGAPLYPVNTGSFNMLSWQFLFIIGVTIGHARVSGRQQVDRPSPWIVAACTAIVVYGIGLRDANWRPLWQDSVYGALLNKPALGLFRMADFGSLAYLVACFGRMFPRALTWKPLAFLGQHSLSVVAAQSVLLIAILPFPALFATAFARTSTAVVVVAFLFVVAVVHRRVVAAGQAPGSPVPVGTERAA
jgi:hypothetical protein